MSERLKRFGLAGTVTLGLSACAVGPDYKTPALALDPVFINAGSPTVNAQMPSNDIVRFWTRFDDDMLSQLVERALAVNGDVRIARSRLQEARAQYIGTRAALFPEIDAAGDASRQVTPEYLLPGTLRGQRTGNAFDAGFLASWELDLFGRNRRATESAAAQADASEAGVHAAHVSVSAEVARNYLELRGLQARYDVALQSLDNQENTLRLTSARLSAGRGTQLDVARAKSLFDSTKATLPALQSAVERTAFRLATLTAQSPRDVLNALAVRRPLPSLPMTDLSALPLGTPEGLLRRRPDLVIAERQLAASTAEIGVAMADLFPRVSLTGMLGLASGRVSHFARLDSQQYDIGAGLTWPVLDFGRVRARIRASEARAAGALANYEQTVATALEETEGALSQFTRAAQQAGLLASSTRNADEATTLSRLRFRAGSVDLLVVLDAERQALASRDAMVRAEVAQATALVDVYRSIGGGWGTPGEISRDARAAPVQGGSVLVAGIGQIQ